MLCGVRVCAHLPACARAGKLKEWVSGQKLGAMVIPKELLDSPLAADLSMMAAEGK